MAQPATGTTWVDGGFADIDPRLIGRGGLQCVMVRDERGEATDISPFSAGFTGATYAAATAAATVGFSPFALDGLPRPDMVAAKLVGGSWVQAATPNEGYLVLGSQTEDGGAELNPTTQSDDLMILQSVYPVDSAITEKKVTVNFKAVEGDKPVVKHLENEQPLCDSTGKIIVPDIGTPNYVTGAGTDPAQITRQLLLWYARKVEGLWLFHVQGFPGVKLDSQAAKQRTKTKPNVADLTFKGVVNPYCMAPSFNTLTDQWELAPAAYVEWVGGPAWEAFGPDGS